jgi:hypothetical protein
MKDTMSLGLLSQCQLFLFLLKWFYFFIIFFLFDKSIEILHIIIPYDNCG